MASDEVCRSFMMRVVCILPMRYVGLLSGMLVSDGSSIRYVDVQFVSERSPLGLR